MMSNTETKKKSGGMWREAMKRFAKNKMALLGLAILIVMTIFAIFAEQIAPYGIDDQDYSVALTRPCKEYILGTDGLGRDIFSRIVFGARTSLSISVSSVLIAVVIGGTLGALAAYYGGILDTIIMRGLDIFLAMPSILMAVAIAAAMGTGIQNTLVAITISQVPGLARIMYSSVISLKEQEYIRAARSIGANDGRILLKHILPNALAPMLVQSTLYVASAILSISSLSFIGLGIQPPTPEWGSMLSAGRSFMREAPYIMVFPGLSIMLTIFGFNLMGDGLRDALDPKLKD